MPELRLHANENPWGPVGGGDDALWQYPEDLGELEQQLAQRLGCRPGDIVLGNGSTELISLLVLALTDTAGAVAACAGSFVAYRSIARGAGRRLQLAPPHPGGGTDLDALRAVIDARTQLVFLANPDNPSGAVLSEEALRRFLCSLPDGPIVVLDEAYREYVDDPRYPLPGALRGPRLVVLRTFSKAYGLAGLRCGYAVCPEAISSRLRALGGPFRVGRLTRTAALCALRASGELQVRVDRTRAARQALGEALRAEGLVVAESHTSFLMVTLPVPAARAAAALLRRGVRVQPLDDYGRPWSIRVTVGRPAGHGRLLSALREIISGGRQRAG